MHFILSSDRLLAFFTTFYFASLLTSVLTSVLASSDELLSLSSESEMLEMAEEPLVY